MLKIYFPPQDEGAYYMLGEFLHGPIPLGSYDRGEPVEVRSGYDDFDQRRGIYGENFVDHQEAIGDVTLRSIQTITVDSPTSGSGYVYWDRQYVYPMKNSSGATVGLYPRFGVAENGRYGADYYGGFNTHNVIVASADPGTFLWYQVRANTVRNHVLQSMWVREIQTVNRDGNFHVTIAGITHDHLPAGTGVIVPRSSGLNLHQSAEWTISYINSFPGPEAFPRACLERAFAEDSLRVLSLGQGRGRADLNL